MSDEKTDAKKWWEPTLRKLPLMWLGTLALLAFGLSRSPDSAYAYAYFFMGSGFSAYYGMVMHWYWQEEHSDKPQRGSSGEVGA